MTRAKTNDAWVSVKTEVDCPTCRGNKVFYYRYQGRQVKKECGACEGKGKVIRIKSVKK